MGSASMVVAQGSVEAPSAGSVNGVGNASLCAGAGQNLNVDPEQELQAVHLAQRVLNRSHVRCRKLSKVLADARFVYCAQLVA